MPIKLDKRLLLEALEVLKIKKIYKIKNIVCKYAVTSKKPQGTSKTNSNNKNFSKIAHYKIHINSLHTQKNNREILVYNSKKEN